MSLDITPCEAQLVDADCLDATVPIPRGTLLLMASACGVSAANIYYNQPLLDDFARQFHATQVQAGLVATAAQVGYGLGLLFFVPLGDLFERRRIVLTLISICAVLLVGTALAPNLLSLIVLQLLVGITAMSAQVLIPLAVDLTPPRQRGGTIGVLMGGLLVGILLARTVSGIVSDHFGWRVMFGIASAAMFLLALALFVGLPHRSPTAGSMTYRRLMGSMLALVRVQGLALISPSFVSGVTFGSFAGFWTVLSFRMVERYGYGASATGLLGVVGVIGVAAAPLAGKLSDRRGPAFTISIGLLITLASFGLMWAWTSIAGLIVGVLIMDLGVQSCSVSTQATVMALLPEARSRMNTLFMVSRFTGGALGSTIAAATWTRWGWAGVCGAACVAIVGGLIVHAIAVRRSTRIPPEDVSERDERVDRSAAVGSV